MTTHHLPEKQPARVASPTPAEVKALRNAAKLTQVEFGAIVYSSGTAVLAWESGDRVCPPGTWELLLLYFGRTTPRTFIGDHAARLAALDEPRVKCASSADSLKDST